MQAIDIERLMEQGFEHLLDIRNVAQMTSLSASTIRRLIKAGRFPKGHRISEYTVRWKVSEIQNWIENIGTIYMENEDDRNE